MKLLFFLLVPFAVAVADVPAPKTIDQHRESGQHAQHAHDGVYDYNRVSDEYEYTNDSKDTTSRHSFILLGKNLNIGYHISFFESRHQHQVILNLNLLKKSNNTPYNKNVFAIEAENDFYSVTSDGGGNKFKLFKIGKRDGGAVKSFPGTFFDGIIGSGSRVSSAPAAKVEIKEVYHFSRLHTDDQAPGAHYMVFNNGSENKKEYILIHMIYGLRSDQNNLEQILLADLDSETPIVDGSILALKGIEDEQALDLDKEYKATYFRKGFDEKATLEPSREISIKTQTEIHYRPFGVL